MCCLLIRSRHVGTTILAVRDAEILIHIVGLDALERLLSGGNVCTTISFDCLGTQHSQIDKRRRLVLEKVDHLDIAVLAKVLSKLVLGDLLKVGDLADIHVAAGSRLNGLRLGL